VKGINSLLIHPFMLLPHLQIVKIAPRFRVSGRPPPTECARHNCDGDLPRTQASAVDAGAIGANAAKADPPDLLPMDVGLPDTGRLNGPLFYPTAETSKQVAKP